MRNSSLGPDGITISQIKQSPTDQLRLLYVAFQAAKYTPEWLREGVVTLIPKVTKPETAADYRPITVASALIRSYHGLIAKRLDLTDIGERQKAYRPRDGMAENLWILKGVLDHAKANYKSIHLVFVDVAKAFDSVNHEALLDCCQRLGVPPDVLMYLKTIYEQGKIKLKGDQDPIPNNSGVRQGDPASGPLFNFMIDRVFASLDPAIGFRVVETLIQFLLFADDGLLFASTKEGLQQQLDNLVKQFEACGLKLNPKKCKSLSIIASAKDKITAVDQKPFLRVGGESIPALGCNDHYKYLGLFIGYEGFDVASTSKVTKDKLERIGKSALRPQQRLAVLRDQLIPGALHNLVLGEVPLGILRNLDVMIRRAVRTWLHLPHDSPLALIHAKPSDGGLGIPSFELRIPRLRRERLLNIHSDNDPLVRLLLNERYSRKRFDCLIKPVEKYGVRITDPSEEARALRIALKSTIDGRNLAQSLTECPSPQHWVTDPSYGISGREFVKAIHVRMNVLKTPARAARGGTRGSNLCRYDQQVANSNHITQVCQATHGARINRHDRIVTMVCSSFKKKGYTILREPRIKKGNSFLKPDIVATYGNVTWVLDPIICSDNADLARRAADKTLLYSVPEVDRFVRDKYDGEQRLVDERIVEVVGLAISNRGAIAPNSLVVLKKVCSLRYINFIILRVLLHSWRIINIYQNRAV
jgi:hypothetical protein